jgi:hypothetical protein
MKLRQSIRKILKEESDRKSKILSMIKKNGFILTTRAFGGIRNLAKILEETQEMLITKYLSKETFSTDDIEKNTGGYDFRFKLIGVKKEDDYTYEFIYIIEEGTVDLSMVDDGTYDLLGKDIRKLNSFWEIEWEIQSILSDFSEELCNKINLTFESIDVNFVFKVRK